MWVYVDTCAELWKWALGNAGERVRLKEGEGGLTDDPRRGIF